MMVTFVSQCEKKSLLKTRRVLDSFANRIGERTWQTVITEEGLLAVRKLLRKTATKNTAVACHWIRSRSRSDLLWVIGKRGSFNNMGYVPVNTTFEKVNYSDIHEDWYYLPVIRSIVSLAALLHDWGKSNIQFQKKMSNDESAPYSDALRHEWVSCLLLNSLISHSGDTVTDNGWLNLLSQGEVDETILAKNDLTEIETPLRDLPPLAQVISYLILTHHKIPLIKNDGKKDYSGFSDFSLAESFNELFSYINDNWGYKNENSLNSLEDCISFYPEPLKLSKEWTKNIKRWSKKLLNQNEQVTKLIDSGGIRLIIYLSRISLMLADHNFSSLPKEKTKGLRSETSLIANTDGNGNAKQTLDQHLVGVHQQAKDIVNLLPRIEKGLPATDNVKVLQKASPTKFQWQDKASRKIKDWNVSNSDIKRGFFAVNIASTGSGKTFANAKIMLALSEEEELRFTLALGLRTLTLQTGDEYRKRIFQGNDNNDLAVIIGSKEIIRLNDSEIDKEYRSGSESMISLMEEEVVYYEEELFEDYFSTVLKDQKSKKLLFAPVLACTIDHIMSATETTRGGRFILPALRLMTSDLVIDEIDDFTGSDSIAIGRLIHLAGMLGRKVMISSATIPPSLAEGYFNSYKEGWKIFSETRNASQLIGCAWIDEFHTDVTNIEVRSHKESIEHYQSSHSKFLGKRIVELRKQPPRRKAEIIKLSSQNVDRSIIQTAKEQYFSVILQASLNKHLSNNQIDKNTNLKVSFGVIRVANISPCVELTKYLLNCKYPESFEIRVMAYHSQQTLLLRSEQEKHLDKVLKRKEKAGEETVALLDDNIRAHLDSIKSNQPKVKNVIFIIVATPVEEVGRDHDLDWAIIEPSSYRSIIQLAGRVRRHRDEPTINTNIGILQYNWKSFRDGDKKGLPYFNYPGYEFSGEVKVNNRKVKAILGTHDLVQLVDEGRIKERLDAIPRISENHTENFKLAQLEHAVTAHWLSNYQRKGPNSLQGYLTNYWYLTAVPQYENPFRRRTPDIKLFRCFSKDREVYFTEKDITGRGSFTTQGDLINQNENYRIEEEDFNESQNKRLWLNRNYYNALKLQSQKDNISLNIGALRYGEITVRRPPAGDETRFYYNDQLGLYKKIR